MSEVHQICWRTSARRSAYRKTIAYTKNPPIVSDSIIFASLDNPYVVPRISHVKTRLTSIISVRATS